MSLISNLRLYSHLILYKLTNPSVRNYTAQWDRFWGAVQTTGPHGQVLWDNVPARASQEDLARFQQYIDPSLPMIDIGCGNGRQTRFLTQHFRQVIGVDVSPAAIELACRECTDQANAEFRVLNATHVEEARALHDELGDVNIYMRGVLHAIQPADRPKVVACLAILLGARGTLYQIELSTAALTYFRQLPGDSPSGLPRLLHSVVRYGIQPVGFNLKDRRVCYPDADWSVLDSGENVTINTVRLSHGAEGHVPANYLLLRQH